jgi:hypothetical protein
MGGAPPVTSPSPAGAGADASSGATAGIRAGSSAGSPAQPAEQPAAQPTAGLVVRGRLEGRGEVYDDDRLLADVDYKLKDVEEVRRVGSAGREHAGDPVGLRNIYGTLIVVEAGMLADLVGRRLRLQLEDGRWLPFTVSKVLGPHRRLIQGLDAAR